MHGTSLMLTLHKDNAMEADGKTNFMGLDSLYRYKKRTEMPRQIRHEYAYK